MKFFNNRRDSEVGNAVSKSRGFDPQAKYPTWKICSSTVKLGVELVVKEKSRVHIWAYTSAILAIVFLRLVVLFTTVPINKIS